MIAIRAGLCIFTPGLYEECGRTLHFKMVFWASASGSGAVCVIYRFGQLWLSKCVSGEGLVRLRWRAPVRGVLRHPSLSLYIYVYIVYCEFPIDHPGRPYAI